MKKADGILILIVLLLCGAFFLWRFVSQKEGASVYVEVNGSEFGSYPLNKDQEIEINDTNVLVISDGEAYMKDATCPDKLCIYQGHISSDGEMIICLPNRVFVEVQDENSSEDRLDAVAG